MLFWDGVRDPVMDVQAAPEFLPFLTAIPLLGYASESQNFQVSSTLNIMPKCYAFTALATQAHVPPSWHFRSLSAIL